MGDNNSQTVIKIGDIAIKMYDGIVRSYECHIFSNLKGNLILLGILEDEGNLFKFNNTLKVMKGFLVVMKWPKRNGLYYLVGETGTSQDSHLFTIAESKFKLCIIGWGVLGIRARSL